MLYEGLKQNSTIVIVPSTAVESMQLGGLAGLTALTMGIGQQGPAAAPVQPQSDPQPLPGEATYSNGATPVGAADALDAPLAL
jgi:hypothetical protein